MWLYVQVFGFILLKLFFKFNIAILPLFWFSATTELTFLLASSGDGGRHRRGVCAFDAGRVWSARTAVGKRTPAACGAGGGAGWPGASPQSCRPRRRGPAPAVHSASSSIILCKYSWVFTHQMSECVIQAAAGGFMRWFYASKLCVFEF